MAANSLESSSDHLRTIWMAAACVCHHLWGSAFIFSALLQTGSMMMQPSVKSISLMSLCLFLAVKLVLKICLGCHKQDIKADIFTIKMEKGDEGNRKQ